MRIRISEQSFDLLSFPSTTTCLITPMASTGGTCAVCGIASTNRCAKCQSEFLFHLFIKLHSTKPLSTAVYYCGAEHQKEDWKLTHKLMCKVLTANNAGHPSTSSNSSPPPAQPSSNTGGRLISQLLDPFFDVQGEELREKMIDSFRLWVDDCMVWRGECIGKALSISNHRLRRLTDSKP